MSRRQVLRALVLLSFFVVPPALAEVPGGKPPVKEAAVTEAVPAPRPQPAPAEANPPGDETGPDDEAAPVTTTQSTQAGETSKLPPAPSGTPADRKRWLGERIDEILARPALAGAQVGVLVATVDDGRTLYAHDERTLFNPASNAKLFTTAAALGLLGPEFRYVTSLYGTPRHGEIDGNLYLRGSGDPSLTVEDLWRMASQLAALGVKRVTGDLLIDDTYFDDARIAPAFDQKDEDYAYRAPAGAVSLEHNACTIRVKPGAKADTPPRVVVEPASPYFTVVNTATTVAQGRTALLVASREVEGHTEITVGGTIHLKAGERRFAKRVAHPDLFTGYTLQQLLSRYGIHVAGKVGRGEAPSGTRLLARHVSQPLGVLVREINKTSNNFMAEQVLKTLGAEAAGRPGTWEKGVQAVGRYLTSLGIPAAGYKMVNGSGLYDADRFSATELVELLRAVYRDFRVAADFVGSLSVAGVDGTTHRRFDGSPAERWVRAKTGTLDGVSCLSGYAAAQGQPPLAFSILMNAVPLERTADARRAQDDIADALVAWLGANAPPAPAGTQVKNATVVETKAP